MKARNIVILVASAIVVAAAGSWMWQSRQPIVAVAAPTRGPAVQAVYATGTVEPIAWSKVGPLATGRIVAILVRDGAEVGQGQPLARIDDREARARLAELEAREAYWRDEVQRQSTLADRGFASRDARDRAQSEWASIQAQVAGQRQRINDLTLVAPMDGIVLRQDGEIGETVEAKSTLFWIGQPSPLRITAEIDEEDIPRIARGQTALVKSDAFPGQVLRGSIAEVTPKGDPVAKNYRVRIALPDDTPLKIGMTTEVNVIVREVADALLVPSAAVRPGPGEARHVFVLDGDVVRRRAVVIGIAGRALTEIRDGLTADMQIVVAGAATLADGQRVRRSAPASAP